MASAISIEVQPAAMTLKVHSVTFWLSCRGQDIRPVARGNYALRLSRSGLWASSRNVAPLRRQPVRDHVEQMQALSQFLPGRFSLDASKSSWARLA